MNAFRSLCLVQIAEAQQGKGASSSAIAAAQDARGYQDKGDFLSAARRAHRSLEHSLGILHPVFQKLFGGFRLSTGELAAVVREHARPIDQPGMTEE